MQVVEKTVSLPSYWWQRDDLYYSSGSLHLSGKSLADLVDHRQTPCYFYSASRILENLGRLGSQLLRQGVDFEIYYAMKSNRFAPVLSLLQESGQCGIDACSPGEVSLALKSGFRAEQISFTGTALTEADIEYLSAQSGLIVNLDSVSGLRSWGRHAPGTKVGIRINPEVGIGYRTNERLFYAGERETKLGIYLNQLDDAIDTAQRHGLTINGLHCHAGSGFLNLENFQKILSRIEAFLERLPALDYINLGGGLGIPLVADDRSLNLDVWGKHVQAFARKYNTALYFEPGDYLVKDSGVLVTTVTMVERKRETLFIGVNAGFNTHIEPAFYKLPLEAVPLSEPTTADPSTWETVTISGNINESFDLFGENLKLPLPKEGDLLCFLNAGGYGSSMASTHCLHPLPKERLITIDGKT